MNTSKTLLATLCVTLTLFSGCTISDSDSNNNTSTTSSVTPRTDLTVQTIIDKDGNEIIVQTSETQTVKNKEATIRTDQVFEKLENVTFTIEKNTTEVTALIKDSTLVIENNAILKAVYIKNSKIIIKKGGDLQITERMKNTQVIIESGTFSVKPTDIDDLSTITIE